MRVSTAIMMGLLLCAGTVSWPARAAEMQCTSADRSTWLPPAQVKKMLAQHGFANIGAIRLNEGNCYVVQATDNSGARLTLYLDPTDGSLRAME